MKKEHRFNVRDFTKRAYEAYFGVKLGNQDKQSAPHKVCKNCTDTLRLWTEGKVKQCDSECLWFGEVPRTTMTIAIFAW